MGGANTGLTLEWLAQRLEVQGGENAERLNALERENARLRDEVAAFRGSDIGCDGIGGVLRTRSAPRAENGAEDLGQATEVAEVRMDRRRLLKWAAAASLVVAGSLTQRDLREAKAEELRGSASTQDGAGVYGIGSNGPGVLVDSVYGIGVVGNGRLLHKEHPSFHDGGHGVVGDGGYGGGEAGLPGAGVLGRNILTAPRDAAEVGGVNQ